MPAAQTYRTLREATVPLAEAERKLWRSVVANALREAQGQIIGVKAATKRDKAQSDALRWVNSPAVRVGSFVWVCHQLRVDPDRIRVLLDDSRLVTTDRQRRDRHVVDLARQGRDLRDIASLVGLSYSYVTKVTRPLRQGRVR